MCPDSHPDAAPRVAEALPPGAAIDRRRRGAFYTPPGLADALTAWAIRRTTQRVFDPGYGGGELLAAAVRRLSSLRRRTPGSLVYGVEVHPEAARVGADRLALLGVPASHLQPENFFATTPADFGGRTFDAIVANPPFVRHHLLAAEEKARARERARTGGVHLGERADAWAYVVGYLLSFLAPGGRMGLVLPSSVLHADYALPILEALGANGRRSRLIRVNEQQFAGITERIVLLLLESTEGPGEVAYAEVPDLDGLRRYLRQPARWSAGSALEKGERSYSAAARRKTRMRWFLPPEVAQLWGDLTSLPEVTRLGDLATIRIGVVTGANRFFVRSRADIKPLLGPGVREMPVVSRGGWPAAPRWTPEDDAARPTAASRLLVVDADAEPNHALRAAVMAAEREGLNLSSHCSKRERWFALTDHAAPDLFLPYMGAEAQRLVVNLSGATCTNSVHRVWRRDDAPSAAEIAAGSWTSVCRLSAELTGRSYGAGVLKLEIGEANDLRIPLLPRGADHVLAIEQALVTRGRDAARAEADRLILRDGLGLTVREIRQLTQAAQALQRRRGH